MIVILGTSGYVGCKFSEYFNSKGIKLLGLSRKSLDYTDKDKFSKWLKDRRIDFVINAAGYTGKPNVDACSSITLRKESIHFLASEPNGGMPNSISIMVTVLSWFKNSFANLLNSGCANVHTKSVFEQLCNIPSRILLGSTGIPPNSFNIID